MANKTLFKAQLADGGTVKVKGQDGVFTLVVSGDVYLPDDAPVVQAAFTYAQWAQDSGL